MNKTVQALLTGLFDYAGLFPPAELGMGEAVSQYADHGNSALSWMLGRFICPAARLQEFASAAPASLSAARISGLGGTGDTLEAWSASLTQALTTLEAFSAENRAGARVDAVETRLPADFTDEPGWESVLERVQSDCRATAPTVDALFLELPRGRGWETRAARAAEGVAALSASPRVGLKIRTGGVEPGAVPSVLEVAAFIQAAAAAGVPFKATAGLHHPFRHFSQDLRADMHGFINLFVAAALARERLVDHEQVCRLLDEREPGAIQWNDEHLRWGKVVLPLPALIRARAEFALSLGSCSFTEPIDDLTALHLL